MGQGAPAPCPQEWRAPGPAHGQEDLETLRREGGRKKGPYPAGSGTGARRASPQAGGVGSQWLLPGSRAAAAASPAQRDPEGRPRPRGGAGRGGAGPRGGRGLKRAGPGPGWQLLNCSGGLSSLAKSAKVYKWNVCSRAVGSCKTFTALVPPRTALHMW